MATTNLYLDTRSVNSSGQCVMKLTLSHRGTTAYISLPFRITAAQWNASKRVVVNHPSKQHLNNLLQRYKLQIDTMLLELSTSAGFSKLSASELRKRIEEKLNPCDDAALFVPYYNRYAATRSAAATKSTYKYTLSTLRKWDAEIDMRTFEDLNLAYLKGFDSFLVERGFMTNARCVLFRNLRAVFNAAITDEVTTFYPFRKFKIKPEKTRHRALSLQELRTLIDYPCHPDVEMYRDLFVLSFCLCGINIVDMCYLKEVVGGRVEYTRAKTKRLYSIKVEREAQRIIDKYKGVGYLLNIMDRYTNYQDFRKKINYHLKRIGDTDYRVGCKKTITPLFPDITTYWARHTWATIAAELDIPKETIAAALGHGGNTVTDIYISFNQRKVDEANRRVLDYVFSN